MRRVRVDTYEQVITAVLIWPTRPRPENAPLSGVLIKEK